MLIIMERYFIEDVIKQLNLSEKYRETFLYHDYLYLDENNIYIITIYLSSNIWNKCMETNMNLHDTCSLTWPIMEWFVVNKNDISIDINNYLLDFKSVIYLSRYKINIYLKNHLYIPKNKEYGLCELYDIDDIFIHLYRYIILLITNNKYNISGLIILPKKNSNIKINKIIIKNQGIYNYQYIHMNDNVINAKYYNPFYNNNFCKKFNIKIESINDIWYRLFNKPNELIRKYMAIDLCV